MKCIHCRISCDSVTAHKCEEIWNDIPDAAICWKCCEEIRNEKWLASQRNLYQPN